MSKLCKLQLNKMSMCFRHARIVRLSLQNISIKKNLNNKFNVIELIDFFLKMILKANRHNVVSEAFLHIIKSSLQAFSIHLTNFMNFGLDLYIVLIAL